MKKDELVPIDVITQLNISIIDVQILMFCLHNPMSITELQRKIGIAHKNLKPHLEKLKENHFIKIKDMGIGKKKIVQTNGDDSRILYFVFGVLALYGLEEARELKDIKKGADESLANLYNNIKKPNSL